MENSSFLRLKLFSSIFHSAVEKVFSFIFFFVEDAICFEGFWTLNKKLLTLWRIFQHFSSFFSSQHTRKNFSKHDEMWEMFFFFHSIDNNSRTSNKILKIVQKPETWRSSHRRISRVQLKFWNIIEWSFYHLNLIQVSLGFSYNRIFIKFHCRSRSRVFAHRDAEAKTWIFFLFALI